LIKKIKNFCTFYVECFFDFYSREHEMIYSYLKFFIKKSVFNVLLEPISKPT